jgi:outer membrane protein OmpA-like peptidoglycan-associated protein
VSASNDPAASPDDVDAAATPGDSAAEPAAVTVEPLTVYFDSGSDSLSAASGAQVEAYAEQLKATSPTSIRVVGYTDSSGSADLNRKLSEARAANVAASLVEAGLPADLISKDAVGEGGLTIETPDAAGQANSRRVVVAPAY